MFLIENVFKLANGSLVKKMATKVFVNRYIFYELYLPSLYIIMNVKHENK